MVTIEEIEKVQEELFRRIEDELSEAEKHDYYLTGKDIYYYTVAIRNLDDYKRCGLPFQTVK